jgi:hypothetical protein
MVFLSDIQSVSSHAVPRNSQFFVCVRPLYSLASFFYSMDIGQSSMIGSIENSKGSDLLMNILFMLDALIIYEYSIGTVITFFYFKHRFILTNCKILQSFILIHKYL